MGHSAYQKDQLVPLIDRLNKYPVGLVDNEKLRQILALLFTEQEALVASRFPLEEATLPELTRATGIEAVELLPILDRMADKGLIMDLPYRGTTYYLLMPGLIGFFEFTFMKHRTDIPLEQVARLMTEYLQQDPEQGQAREFFGSPTQLTRSLVYEEHIPTSSTIVSYENAREIIRKADFGAVGLCYCRHKKHHEGKHCKKNAPLENICISLGTGARFLARRGFAQEKTTTELLEIIDRARSLRLTHVTDNIRHRPTFICNCCQCCCEIMAGVQMGYYQGVAKTGFLARIDPESCTYCGECFMACNVRAIGLDRQRRNGRVSSVRIEKCLGCGACISACEESAISLVPRERKTIPLNRKRDLYAQILKEKGRLTPFIFSRIRKALHKLVPGTS